MTREYVKKIKYPCETAAIFQDVVFVMRVNDATELLSAADRARECNALIQADRYLSQADKGKA